MSMSVRCMGGLAVLLAALLAGCGGGRGGASTSGRPVLRVAVASDLQPVFPTLAERFERSGPGVVVVPVYGSSGQLAQQIEAGAPFDVFLSANRGFVAKLADTGTVDPGSVKTYAFGSLALLVRQDAGNQIGGLADLAGPAVKLVAIANPETAPYGAAARQALQRAGLWETLGPKFAVLGTVRQALRHVETGNAEAGLLSRSLSSTEGIRSIEVDPALYDPIEQSLGVVARSPHRRSAEAFARFVLGAEGREVLVSHGFRPPGGL